ncbi:hypothetical protein AQUCO_01300070v1 [Aquilegia coerulea]|uniref:DCD domain-containing protein n=1 Tax=Aquilegia coerulea TaxID=218851 RepID=A0A2G5DZH9_AQUCA|nr:hypothetical protein AQUCO_01300070v1 [Aquilegia coerulea]
MENNNQQSFMQFSDQLRLQGSNFGNLSINDSIWSSTFTTKKPEERKNFDIRVGAQRKNNNTNDLGFKQNGFNNGWKISGIEGVVNGNTVQKSTNLNGVFNKGVYFKSSENNITNNNNFNTNITYKTNEKSRKNEVEGKFGKKSNYNNSSSSSKSSVDKRFKSLPLSESLPKGEVIGGYIFVCNNDTMQENLQRQLFGLPPRYRDSVRAITPGLPLFLYNYSNHQLHGIFEASSFGGANIDPKAWEDKKCPGESRFPAQVKVVTRKVCDPLEEDSFRPILHHYDGPKFRLELSVPEALALLDIFAES